MAPCVPTLSERVVERIKASPEWAAHLAEVDRLVLYGTGEGEPQGLIHWKAPR